MDRAAFCRPERRSADNVCVEHYRLDVCFACLGRGDVTRSKRNETPNSQRRRLNMDETKKCIECRKAISASAKLCVECGSHQDWRRHIKTWTPLFGFFLAFLAFIFSIAPQVRSALFPSPPKFSAHIRSVSERSITFDISNLGERRLIVDPVLKCVSGNRIDEEIVDYEKPFRVWFTTVEGQSDRPITITELGGSELTTFTIPEDIEGSWLDKTAIFLPPDDERVSGIERRFSPGLRHTWFGADRSSNIPTYHFIGKNGLISLQAVSEISTFCQLTTLDPVTGEETIEGFAIWQLEDNLWRGSRANQLYNVLGSLISISAHGLNETDPALCESDSPPWSCITAD